MTIQQRPDEMANLLAADFPRRSEPSYAWHSACSSILALPGLRGFWPMSSFDEAGNAADLSGQGRTLTYVGNPIYRLDGLAPYIDLDGTGDCLSRADEAGLDITGTEAYVGAPGLTLGGWFWLNVLPSPGAFGLMAKYLTAGNQKSYLLSISTTNLYRAYVSTDGAATVTSNGPLAIIGAWTFAAIRFIPSTELLLFVQGQFYRQVVAIPASIFPSTATFYVGAYGAATALLNGRASLCWICASALSDGALWSVYEQQRPFFGV